MLRKSVWTGFLFLFILVPSTLLAQGMMHGKWWSDRSIVNELELTPEEKKELDEKYIESRRKMIDLKSEIEKQRFELDLLLSTSDADKQAIMARFASLEQARANLSKARFEMLMQIRDTIGAERYQDLKFLYRDRDGKYPGRYSRNRSHSRDMGRD